MAPTHNTHGGHTQNELIVGLDIGTTKICCVIGEMTEEGLDIIGFGKGPSTGLAKGMVINVEATAKSIRRAVEDAEMMANVEVRSVYAGIAGSHIKSFNSHGIVAIKGGEVTHEDVAQVLDAARAVPIPKNKEILHVIPQEYIIDGQGGIKDPIGMSGVRLETRVHVITGAVTSAQNVIKCAKRCGLEVADLVLEQVASSEAVLSEDERQLGVCLVDIGGGTTDIAIYSKGSLVHTHVLTVGGNYLTNDIAVGLRTPLAEAERLKQRHGCAMVDLVSKDDEIQVSSVGDRPPQPRRRQLLCEIIEPRAEEIFDLVAREIQLSGFEDALGGGVVITGGTSVMQGMDKLGSKVLFGLPVRMATPRNVGGLVDVVRSPKYATAVGLVQYGARMDEHRYLNVEDNRGWKFTQKIRAWLNDLF